AESSGSGAWRDWTGYFPPGKGLPGDPLTEQNPFTVTSYLVRTASMLGALLRACQARATAGATPGPRPDEPRARSVLTAEGLTESIGRLFKYGLLATLAGLVEAVGILEAVL